MANASFPYEHCQPPTMHFAATVRLGHTTAPANHPATSARGQTARPISFVRWTPSSHVRWTHLTCTTHTLSLLIGASLLC